MFLTQSLEDLNRLFCMYSPSFHVPKPFHSVRNPEARPSFPDLLTTQSLHILSGRLLITPKLLIIDSCNKTSCISEQFLA